MKKSWKEKRCDICGIISSGDVHHIIPKSQGGSNQKSNIAYLCVGCHRKVHQSKITVVGWKTSTKGRELRVELSNQKI